jgi:hypothetical protein
MHARDPVPCRIAGRPLRVAGRDRGHLDVVDRPARLDQGALDDPSGAEHSDA